MLSTQVSPREECRPLPLVASRLSAQAKSVRVEARNHDSADDNGSGEMQQGEMQQREKSAEQWEERGCCWQVRTGTDWAAHALGHCSIWDNTTNQSHQCRTHGFIKEENEGRLVVASSVPSIFTSRSIFVALVSRDLGWKSRSVCGSTQSYKIRNTLFRRLSVCNT